MNDPHVDSLEYRFINDDSTRVFKSPSPRDNETQDFNLHLADDLLTVKMKTHCATEQEARALVDPFLHAWEIDQALQRGGRRAIRFDFLKPNVIDRHPPPAGSHVLLAGSGTLSFVVNAATLVTTSPEYPAPPANFVASSDVSVLWTLYKEHAEGRARLADVAYACFTYVTKIFAKDVAGAGRKLNISSGRDGVLRTLGRLSGGKGLRKFPTEGPFTRQEAAWVNEAVRTLIRRVGEQAAGAALNEITMADLPPLS